MLGIKSKSPNPPTQSDNFDGCAIKLQENEP